MQWIGDNMLKQLSPLIRTGLWPCLDQARSKGPFLRPQTLALDCFWSPDPSPYLSCFLGFG